MTVSGPHKFEARLWLIDECDLPDGEGPPQDVFWVPELIPMLVLNKRSIAEWLEEDFREIVRDRWEECGLDRGKNWQVLIKGSICGTYNYNNEYDTELDYEVVSAEEVPDDFLN